MIKTFIICAIVFAICLAFPKIAAAAVGTVSVLLILAAFGIIKVSVSTF